MNIAHRHRRKVHWIKDKEDGRGVAKLHGFIVYAVYCKNFPKKTAQFNLNLLETKTEPRNFQMKLFE